MDLELRETVAVVTGAASGIGLACARGLAQEGCRVALWDLSNQVMQGAESSPPSLATRLSVCPWMCAISKGCKGRSGIRKLNWGPSTIWFMLPPLVQASLAIRLPISGPVIGLGFWRSICWEWFTWLMPSCPE